MRKLYLTVMISLLLASCATLNMPVLGQLGDAKYWVVVRPIEYEVEQTGKKIIVPKGFITDLASVPRALWTILSPIDNYMSAAIIHDYLYWDQRCTKEEADDVLYLAMEEYGVGFFDRNAIYDGVYAAGQESYDANAKLKHDGESRLLTGKYVEKILNEPIDSTVTWMAVEKSARQANELVFVDASNKNIKEACVAASNFKSK